MCIPCIPRACCAGVDHCGAMRGARQFFSATSMSRMCRAYRALAGAGRLLLAVVPLCAPTPYVEAATTTQTPPPVWPTLGWETAQPADIGMDATQLQKARDYALTGGGSGVITRYGRSVMTWGSQSQLYDLKSATKSIGVTALGVAIGDNLVALQDKARLHLFDLGVPPSANELTGWLDEVSVLQLATHSAGFDKPGGFIDLLYRPGTTWSYSDGGANWLADMLTVTFAEDLKTVMFSRVFTYLGVTSADLTWRNNQYRGDTINGIKRREFGAGIRADVDAMARIGYLYLRRGNWDGVQLVPGSFVDQASRPDPSISVLGLRLPASFPNAQKHYGLLWWNNGDGTLANVPKDAYWAWGLYDSLIVVIPSLDIVAARAGSGWRSGWDANYAVVGSFIEPIVTSVTGAASGGTGNGSLLSFDGNDDMLRVPSSASLSPISAISVEAWIRPRTIANSKSQDRIVGKASNYELTISTGDTGCGFGTQGHVQWRVTIGGVDQRMCGGVLATGRWHHVAATYNGQKAQLYVDGSLVASASRSGAIAVSSADLFLGNRSDGTRGYDGDLDSVSIWSRALSSAEILAHQTQSLSGSESGLAAHYELNEGAGQTVGDASPNGNAGLLGTTASVESRDPVWSVGSR